MNNEYMVVGVFFTLDSCGEWFPISFSIQVNALLLDPSANLRVINVVVLNTIDTEALP